MGSSARERTEGVGREVSHSCVIENKAQKSETWPHTDSTQDYGKRTNCVKKEMYRGIDFGNFLRVLAAEKREIQPEKTQQILGSIMYKNQDEFSISKRSQT